MPIPIGKLLQLGALPSSAEADLARLLEIEGLLKSIEIPISGDEVRALIQLFGPDECLALPGRSLHNRNRAQLAFGRLHKRG